MLIFDLEFTDGKRCRYLCPDPYATVESERADLEAMFCGRLASMVRIIAPPPEKLPWEVAGYGEWRLGLFKLKRSGLGSEKEFKLEWPGGSISSNNKDEISAAVRLNWHLGC